MVPLDLVTAGEMPGLAARLRIDSEEGLLQNLYSRQVPATLSNDAIRCSTRAWAHLLGRATQQSACSYRADKDAVTWSLKLA